MNVPAITAAGRAKAEETRAFFEHWLSLRKDKWAGKPFILEDWIYDDFILPLYGTLNPDGTRWYDRAMLGVPRWNGKSQTVAGLSARHMYLEPVPDGEMYAVATTIPQANITLGTLKGMVNANRELRSMTDIYRKELVVKESGCVFRSLAHDADTAQGFHPSFVAMDEIHVYKDTRMIDAMLSGMVGASQPLMVAITTAGDAERGVWWEIRRQWEADPHALVVWYGASHDDDPTDPAVWRKANPASWITDEMLESAYRRMPLTSFMRYHLNLAPGIGQYPSAIPPDVWMSEANRRDPVFDPGRPSVMAVDAADKRDRTAYTVIQVDAAGDYNVWCDVRFNDKERDYADYLALEQDIRETAIEYNVERIGFDRRQMARTMTQLEDEGYPVEEVNQSNELMYSACQFLFDLAATGRLRHGGDPVLAAHIASAAAYERQPYGWRFAKADRHDPECKIDAAVSTAMAAWMAQASPQKVDFVSGGLHSIRL
jgi:phage terminase large subunit-like protein